MQLAVVPLGAMGSMNEYSLSRYGKGFPALQSEVCEGTPACQSEVCEGTSLLEYFPLLHIVAICSLLKKVKRIFPSSCR